MSLRRRLLIVVVLAAVALAAAALAILHVLTSTDAARVRAVESTLAASTEALSDALRATQSQSLGSSPRDDGKARRARSQAQTDPTRPDGGRGLRLSRSRYG